MSHFGTVIGVVFKESHLSISFKFISANYYESESQSGPAWLSSAEHLLRLNLQICGKYLGIHDLLSNHQTVNQTGEEANRFAESPLIKNQLTPYKASCCREHQKSENLLFTLSFSLHKCALSAAIWAQRKTVAEHFRATEDTELSVWGFYQLWHDSASSAGATALSLLRKMENRDSRQGAIKQA